MREPQYNTPESWFETFRNTRIDKGFNFYVDERSVFDAAEKKLSKVGYERFRAMVDGWKRRNEI